MKTDTQSQAYLLLCILQDYFNEVEDKGVLTEKEKQLLNKIVVLVDIIEKEKD